MVGLAWRSRTAIPAIEGVAALVPRNGAKFPPRLVLTASAASPFGFARTSGPGSGLPPASNRRVIGPRELNTSGVDGLFQLEAATVNVPLAAAASGLIVFELVGCSAMLKVAGPCTMYFMNGVPEPATRRIAIPIG